MPCARPARAAFLTAVAALGAALGAPLPGQAERPPHVVLVMADDQGLGDMGYTGHPRVRTPNFDAAAAAGLRFDRFYAAAPVCSPTRASVLTGRHPNRMGVFKWGHSMRPQETTVAEILRNAGYATAHFGKWHVGSVRAEARDGPGHSGFDHWLSAPNFYDNDPVLSRRGRAVACPGESSMVVVDAALEWMRARLDDDAPVFAVVWFGSPHAPHRAVDEDRAPYADLDRKLQHFYGEITGMDRAFGKLRRGLDDLGIRDDTILWYCSDNGALPGVGNTAGTRGHKGQVWEGGLRVPAFVEWPARIRTPRSTDLRCNTSDILPTVVELAGASRDGSRPLDGISLARLIRDGEAPAARGMGFWDYPARGKPVYADRRLEALMDAQARGLELPLPPQSRDPGALPEPPLPDDTFPGHAAWIADGWKLHRIEEEAPDEATQAARTRAQANEGDGAGSPSVRFELYHLDEDPAETSDLAGDEAQAARLASMRADLEAWMRSVVASCNGADD